MNKILVLIFAAIFLVSATVAFAYTDADYDGIDDSIDNCLGRSNPDQVDVDNDGYGNRCDPDFDNDCLIDWDDAYMLAAHFGSYCVPSTCGEGYSCWGDYSGCYHDAGWEPLYDLAELWPIPDEAWIDIFDIVVLGSNFGGIPGPSALNTTCQTNNDGDGVPDVLDNCPNIYNPDQADFDGDGIGDVCDPDTDNDGILDIFDNCPNIYNPDQADFDGDGIGDVCDSDIDGDGVLNINDQCPLEDATGFDADHNGCIDTITGLTNVINTLPSDVLSDEIKNSLTSKVDNALKSVDKTQDDAAINQLQAFINQVNAQRGKKISEEAADMLVAYANNLIAKIRAG